MSSSFHRAAYSQSSIRKTGAFAKIAALSIFAESSILDVWPSLKYASALYPQDSAKMQLLNKLSEILQNFASLFFFQNSFKIVLKQFKIV